MVTVHLDSETYLRWLADLGDLWIGRKLPRRTRPVTARRTIALTTR